MIRQSADTWQEKCKLLLGRAMLIPTDVTVWVYDGKWGGEAILPQELRLQEQEPAALLLYLESEHPIEIKSVSHRGPSETTIHFVGAADPPFSPHAEAMADRR